MLATLRPHLIGQTADLQESTLMARVYIKG